MKKAYARFFLTGEWRSSVWSESRNVPVLVQDDRLLCAVFWAHELRAGGTYLATQTNRVRILFRSASLYGGLAYPDRTGWKAIYR